MKKQKFKSFFLFLTIGILSVATFFNASAAGIYYSPGSNLAANNLSPLNDPLLQVIPQGNNIVSQTAIASISNIVLKENNVAQPVSSPEAIFSGTTTTPNVSATQISNNLTYTNITVTSTMPTISAPAYIICNANTKQIYGAKDSTNKYEPAGIVNLMTAYLATQTFDMNHILKVTNEATRQVDKDAAIAGLYGNDKITVKDAIASMFVRSCADSANVIAENVSGSVDEFVKLMNETAKSLGCQNTNFVNPSGTNDGNQYTTAYDMAIIMDKVTENAELVELLKLSQYTLPATNKREKLILFSKNTQLSKESPNYNSDIAGSRMGYTSKTGYCISSFANHKGHRLIAIVLNAKGTQFDDTKKLIEFGKLAYEETNR